MGAGYEDIRRDYMISFRNYYGTEPGTEQYERVAVNLDKVLKAAFKADDLPHCDLEAEAAEYLRGLGVSEETLAAVKKKIGE